MTGRQRTSLALLVAAVLAIAFDWLIDSVRGLGPAALLIAVGWLFILRTEQEMAPAFTGPERHLPWLQATGWFFIGAGLVGVLLSLLAAL